MKYRNIKNGAVIDISCILTDVDWEALEPSKPQPEQEEVKPEEPQPVEEIQPVEEVKKIKKKTVKKG